MIAVAGRIFSAVVKRAGLQVEGESTLYTAFAIRPSCIAYC